MMRSSYFWSEVSHRPPLWSNRSGLDRCDRERPDLSDRSLIHAYVARHDPLAPLRRVQQQRPVLVQTGECALDRLALRVHSNGRAYRIRAPQPEFPDRAKSIRQPRIEMMA